MKTRIVVLIAMVSVIAGILTASVAAQKQNQVSTTLATSTQSGQLEASQGQVLSGSNVGIRIVSQQGDKLVGTLVVKVGSEWKDVTLPASNVSR